MALTKPLYETNTGQVYEALSIAGLNATIARENGTFEEIDLGSGEYKPLWGPTNNAVVPVPLVDQNVIPAKLGDWATDPPTDIDVGLTAVIYSGNIVRMSSTSPVPRYLNGQKLLGNWIGVGIEVPAGTELAKTRYNISDDPAIALRPLNQTSADTTEDGKDYIEFYFDIGASVVKNFISVSWDGTNGGRQIYRIDYSKVQIEA